MASLIQYSPVWSAMFTLFILFILLVILRRQWLAVAALVLIFPTIFFLSLPRGFHGAALYRFILLAGLGALAMVAVLIRFGLLALMMAFFISTLLDRLPITFDFSAWYAGASMLGMLAVIAIAGYGFHTALAGRPLFRDELFEA